MTLSIDNAVAYDVESFPNLFTLTAEKLFDDTVSTWEISQYRDDRTALLQWFNWLNQTQTPMVGFFSLKYDYALIHWIAANPHASPYEIYLKSKDLSKNFDGWQNVIWARDRFAPQIDLFHIHHFDNKAKRTDLKSLEINMRSPSVVDCPVPFDVSVAAHDVPLVIGYNGWDVSETKKFAHHSMKAIKYRIGLIPTFGIDVMNYNDVKIGVKMFEQRLGDDVCYDTSSGRKQKRQTPRTRIALRDIIFPYIQFNDPEFQRVLAFMKEQVLTPDDLDDPDASIKTKGVFKGLVAHVGGLEFVFGTGGVHASVEKKRFIATEDWLIRDIDVKALYPNIAIKNGLFPEHLGPFFVQVYQGISEERDKHAKGTVENATLKLANNGPWGQSNNKFSVFLDPKYAMTVPINGQLMICMLVEWLKDIPTLNFIQANTDGITYRIHRDYLDQAKEIEKRWQDFTCLTLEDASYARMWIRDVNNYIAEPVTKPGSNEPPAYKQKGAYWHPDPFDYADSISAASPPCWYKDLGNIVSIRAAIAAMTQGIDPRTFIMFHTDPYDFMCRVKVDRSCRLMIGGRDIQRVSRYYVSTNGQPMTIERPPAGPEGTYKRRNGVTEQQWRAVMEANGWQWDATVCTGKADKPSTWGKYEKRITNVEAGWLITECNDVRNFSFDNINYDWYVQEAEKLIIS